MRHIFHTCMLALRLVSSVDVANARNYCLDFFDNAFLNSAFCWFYNDQTVNDRKTMKKTFRIVPEQFSQTA